VNPFRPLSRWSTPILHPVPDDGEIEADVVPDLHDFDLAFRHHPPHIPFSDAEELRTVSMSTSSGNCNCSMIHLRFESGGGQAVMRLRKPPLDDLTVRRDPKGPSREQGTREDPRARSRGPSGAGGGCHRPDRARRSSQVAALAIRR